MKTKKVAELADNLPTKEKLIILELIDLKVESDMEKVMNKIESLNTKMNMVLWVIAALGILMSIYKFLG